MKKQFLPLLLALVLVGCGQNNDATTTTTPEPTTTAPVVYNINAASDIVGGSISFSSVEAIEGATISVYAVANEGYSFVSFSSNVDSVNFTQVDTAENVEYTFVMPASDITVSATFTANNYSVSSSSIANGSLSFSVNEATMGTSVVVNVTANEGYELATIGSENDGVILSPIAVGSQYKFNMPASNVVIDATFTAIEYDVIVASSIKGGTVNVSPVSAKAGEEVTITYAANAGYSFDEVTTNIADLALTAGDLNTYTFLMPASNVVVDASFTANTFIVDTVSVEGGSLLVSTNKNILGEEVTVTVITEDGYRFDGLTSNDEDLVINEVEASKTYSFLMPENNVTLTPAFTAAVEVLSITTDYSTRSLTSSLKVGDVLYPGATQTLTLTDSNTINEANNNSIYIHINGAVYHPTLNPENTKETSVEFTVPETDLEIAVVSSQNEESETGFTATFEHDEYVNVYGYEADKTYTRLSPDIFIKHGYAVSSVKYLKEGLEDVETNWEELYCYFYNDEASPYLDLASIASNITVKIEGEMLGEKRISYANLDQVTWGYDFYETAVPGTDISMRFSAKEANTYIKSIKVYGIEGVNEFTDSVSFTMPNNDVIIVFDVANNGTITVEESIAAKDVAISSSSWGPTPQITSCAPGGYFYLFFNAVDGYKITDIEINGVGGNSGYINTSWASEYKYYASLDMPRDGSDVTIKFVYDLLYSVSIDETMDITNGTISLNSGTFFAAGETVNVTINPIDVYHEVDTISVVGHDDIEVEIVDSHKQARFVMPEENVTLTATFKASETVNGTLNTLPTAEEGFSSITFRGQTSSSSLKEAGTTRFLKGEKVSLIVYTSLHYEATITITDSEGEKVLTPTHSYKDTWSTPNTMSYSFEDYVSNSDFTVTINISEATPLTVTVINEVGANLSYKVNNVDVDNIEGSLFVGDNLIVETDEAEEGYTFLVYVTYTNDGSSVGMDYYKEYYSNVSKDITITVKKCVSYTISFVTDCSWYGTIYIDGNSNYIGTSYNTTSLSVLEGQKVGWDSYGWSQSFVYGYSKCHISVTMGDTEIISGEFDSNESCKLPEFEVTGNVIVTITAL